MTQLKRGLLRTAFSFLCLAGVSITALAATSYEGINKVTITIDATIEDGSGTLDVTSNGEGYVVDSFEFTDGASFEPGETPKVSVVLTAEDGYRFDAGFPKGRVTIKGEGDCTGVSRKSGGLSLEITARLKTVAGVAGKVDNAYWADSPLGKAKWDSAANVNAYEVKLYYKNSVIKRVERTTATTYDFYSHMTKAGEYHFAVRPVAKNSADASQVDAGDWVESDEIYIERDKTAPSVGDTSQGSGTGSPSGGSPSGSVSPGAAGPGGYSGALPTAQGGWVQTDKGFKYTDANGLTPSNSWRLIDNKWYFFDMAGVMQTGWLRWNGQQYFLTVNGDMVTGWLQNNRDWYFMGADGAMQTGWAAVGGIWYYMDRTGIMQTGWQYINERWYYFDINSGAMAANTSVGDRYLGGDGAWVQQ